MITKEDRMTTGVVDYFRNALAAVGRWSRFNNEAKYPPVDGTRSELKWSFDVSTNHADAILSHLSQRGEIDPETGFSHTVALAWRALALLETELIGAGATPGKAVLRSQKLAVAAFSVEELERVWAGVPPTPPAPMQPPPRDPFAGLSGGPDDFPGDEYAAEAVR